MSNKEEILASLKKSIETWDIKLAETAAKQALTLVSNQVRPRQGLGKGMETISQLFDDAKIFAQVLAAPPWRRHWRFDW